ncbi:MAG: excinuclease ABC subunit A [Candidatus Marinimicrobia bacterium]|nr:excinuclease ABC subunit A [Candidatus Neomarinimicrobiota bacterium]|tara:strand:+ start:45691 stop:48489 length:2799 start_codon:yes stop_codon:yes gene_type:complete
MSQSKNNTISVFGAREHNLKNITVHIPRNKLVVITGLSGSGKSSLAFDTLYAEGQRRYVESLSTYARQFLGMMSKPAIDNIEGLSPAISIEQKTKSKNPRSTVGTITEIYDYLRLLYARVGIQQCYKCNQLISKQSLQQIVDSVLQFPESSKLYIMSPIIKEQKGEHKNLIQSLLSQGFIRARIDGKIIKLTPAIKLVKTKKHSIDIIIDRIIISKSIKDRVTDSINTAVQLGQGMLYVLVDDNKEYMYNKHLYCSKCSISYEELEPRCFSFNSPQGACSACLGLGSEMKVDPDLIVPDKRKSLLEGCLAPYRDVATSGKTLGNIIKELLDKYNLPYSVPWYKIPKEIRLILLYGQKLKNSFYSLKNFEGIIKHLERRYTQTQSSYIREWIEKFMAIQPCNQCKGSRLKKTHTSVYINNINIYELGQLSITDTLVFFNNLKLNKAQHTIADGIIKEIINRLLFLENVGLDYLNLNRTATTLSGGESQRIKLAAQIGLNLVGVMYILDEPSIGLHQRDNQRLISTLQSLRNLGNTIIVIEHDEETMRAADWIIDIGPGAGIHGGNVIAQGTPKQISKDSKSITGQYLSCKKKIQYSSSRRLGNKKFITLKGACGNNLKNVNLTIPLNKFVCITGVSGSGKSTLINQTLYPCLAQQYYGSSVKPLKNDGLDGMLYLDKVIEINQSPIGKTPRSNPATYTGLFSDIRELFTKVEEAKIRGYKPGRFSFNVKGGRCETCQGMGVVKVEMHFLADMFITCDECDGKRFNRETLEIYYNKKNIHSILEMSIEEAYDFFINHKSIQRKLDTLLKVGLGYIKLGQRANTLSGGESQRIKLAKELSKIYTGRTLYILDEPTTGLHFQDIQLLLDVLHDLTDNGNTIIVIEHNLDVIKTADWIIDIGPNGGDNGGKIIGEGTPEDLVKTKNSHTAKYLKPML